MNTQQAGPITEAQFTAPDRQARFTRLLAEYGPALQRLTRAYTLNPAQQDDLFQEIALALWQALPHFRGEASERTWLYRIAHNVALTTAGQFRRRAQRETPWLDNLDQPAAGMDSEGAVLQHERQTRLLAGIATLSPTDRQLILLHLEGLSYAEIEDISHLSSAVIATRLSRIRSKLSNQIHDERRRP